MIPQLFKRGLKRMVKRVVRDPDWYVKQALDQKGITAESVILGILNGRFITVDHKTGKVDWNDTEKRGIIPIDDFHVSKKLQRLRRQERFQVTSNQDFEGVLQACAERDESWISAELKNVYRELFRMGCIHCIESWQNGELVGGLFGFCWGKFFMGESQFNRVSDASKIAFVELCEQLRDNGFELHDTQFKTDHLSEFGCVEISRDDFRQRQLRAIVGMNGFHRSQFNAAD